MIQYNITITLILEYDVAINYIFSPIWRCYGPKQGIFDYWGKTYFVYYPIISYQKIKVYRVETIDMGISHWNNGVSGTILMEQRCQCKMQYW